MRITIIRHGKAHPRSESGQDRDRALTDRGVRQAQWLGSLLRSQDPRSATLLSSPYERAITTARIVGESLGLTPEVAAELECDEPLSPVISLLERRRDQAPLILIGHNPQLSGLASLLCDGHGSHRFNLRTGEAAVVLAGEELIGGCELLEMLRLDEE